VSGHDGYAVKKKRFCIKGCIFPFITKKKQIEYWFRVGKIVEEHPDRPYSFIKDILLSQEEADDQQVPL
jgi:hypothetical protein